MTQTPNRNFSIRPARVEDAHALTRICLLTANAGQSAEALHRYPELLGGLYIYPYLKLSPAFGYVLVDNSAEKQEAVLGYLLATPDSRRHEAAAEEHAYPSLRIQYPNDPYPADATERDRVVINRIHKPLIRPQDLVDVASAHIHINLLPPAQRQGWGVKLIDQAVEYLKGQGQSGLFVGIDSRNGAARAFYLKIGFKHFPFPDKEYFVLHFDDWKGPEK
ncbi:hypothetical protein CTheo_8226 [Ceratobasidium theobromae]|uniref:N-acetyltransferase domain-containing protein n=1 Tax=Ceratobasidium theobromae TaxID=1582974 RepID=A0A5N5QAA7_9AGAM|nr:hypothetical protein CTheo_8226 [Ceratobasidium theobromae]